MDTHTLSERPPYSLYQLYNKLQLLKGFESSVFVSSSASCSMEAGLTVAGDFLITYKGWTVTLSLMIYGTGRLTVLSLHDFAS